MALTRKDKRNVLVGLAFLGPNILGFLMFICFPLLFSLFMAFSNWDLKLHNMFKDTPIQIIGFENFRRLLTENEFWKYLGNTLFMMMGIPFSIAGSLIAAMLLSRDPHGGNRRIFAWLIAAVALTIFTAMLVATGMGGTAMTLMMVGLACGVLLVGTLGGNIVYRTFFYTPYFVSGVATYLLWKKLYAPTDGPINRALRPVLAALASGVNSAPATPISQGGLWLCWLGLIVLLWFGLHRLRIMWRDGDLGEKAAVIPIILLLLPAAVGATWWPTLTSTIGLAVGAALILGWQISLAWRTGKAFSSPSAHEGFGTAVVLALGIMVGQFVLLGIGKVLFNLPAMAANGLEAPQWIYGYDWAKPSLMIMAFWGAIGSNNMLLYLAALSNVPEELYEAAGIDGASPFQRFWHITWPQLAPTTFFIVVMSTIGGIQGGFEMARVMTQGGPAGATTFLSYFIYIAGFEQGRLGYASAIAWVLFLIVFAVTLFNWKFGNQYVND